MNVCDLPDLATPFGSAPGAMLGAILDQSADCIKVVSPSGTIDYMNRNGQCALEIDDFCTVAGQPWAALWPPEGRPAIEAAMARARDGQSARFEAFCPTVRGTPRWWDVSVSPLLGPDARFDGFIVTSRDVTERVSHGALRDAIADEMRHRLRNNYVVVIGLLMAHARGRPEQAGFVREMSDRLTALGTAQALTLASGPVPLAVLVPALVEAYATPDCPIVIAPLPAFELGQAMVDTLALVLGELAVNSAKHGALSATGRVGIDALTGAAGLELRWSERSDRPVAARHRDGGQGLRLMERVLAARGGGIALAWHPGGLDATITLPG